MRKTKKKVVSIALCCAMLASITACGGNGNSNPTTTAGTTPAGTTASNTGNSSNETTTAAPESSASNIVKPESLRIVHDGTILTEGLAEFGSQVSELVGVNYILDQQDHSAYADAVGRVFASGDWPDIILLPAGLYATYATTGALWDMTDMYEQWKTELGDRLVSNVNDGLKINGRLYGFAPTRGNGCITYVKQAWLDAVGIQAPTNWDEYYNMLKLFTENDPDGDGTNDTYGVNAAGIIGGEAPYTNFLPEFYQKAYPDFIQGDDGVWYDGFNTDDMVAALERLQSAYQAKYLDPESLTDGTKDVRNKFYDDKFGAFTYWAGTWNQNIINNLEAQGLSTDLVLLEPIDGLDQYIERQSAMWCITTACQNPEGAFEYFIKPMLDDGDVQFRYTYGAKGFHWDDKAETVVVGEGDAAVSTEYKDGEFHMMTNQETKTLFTKNHLDPALTVAPLSHAPQSQTDAAVESNEFFIANSKLAPFLPSSDVLNDYNGDLWELKRKVITEVVVNGNDVATWMDHYRTNSAQMVEEVLADLNK